MFDKIEAYLSAQILKYLARPTGRYAPFYAPAPDVVRDALQPGDILLVEGNTRLAATITSDAITRSMPNTTMAAAMKMIAILRSNAATTASAASTIAATATAAM